NIVISDERNIIIEDSILTRLYVNPVNIESACTQENIKQKSFDKVLKDVNKGKLSENVMIYLRELLSQYSNLSDQVGNRIKEDQNKLSSIEHLLQDQMMQSDFITKKINKANHEEDLAIKYNIIFESSDFPKRDKEIVEQVENQYYRPKGKHNPEIDHILQIEGWEWVNGELRQNTIHYPQHVTYKYSEAYPDYRILDNCVYDSIGNLVRVISYDGSDLYSEIKEAYVDEQVIQDYKNNKYGILQKSKDVKYAIENKLGLSKEHNNRINQINSQVSNTYVKANGKGKKAAEKAAQNILGMFLANEQEKSRMNNQDAINFIRQCTEDHKDEFGELWKTDRESEISFRIAIYSEKLNEVRYYIVDFSTEEPFGKTLLKYHKQ
ncbi:MAG: hypothetical protein K2H38_11285, partial [Muribaculaceae bacterium]|nr:hypothetical protein [Muribaculaceae bacterium]